MNWYIFEPVDGDSNNPIFKSSGFSKNANVRKVVLEDHYYVKNQLTC